ncbi:MAG: metallophosphoesterase [Candidatus Heimdallarchaeota archaeon]|nr:metallophosphoesterase [Candidatus Heimdallarchaeota archaeon]
MLAAFVRKSLIVFIIVFSAVILFSYSSTIPNVRGIISKANIAFRFDELLVYSDLLWGGYSSATSLKDYNLSSNCPSVVFVGHIYPKNGFYGDGKPPFPDTNSTFSHFSGFIELDTPSRVIFGGDSIWTSSSQSLHHLSKIKDKISGARFILGNHEEFWTSLARKQEGFASIFPKRYWYEDLSNIRLIYLHSIKSNGEYGLDDEQINFLQRALDNKYYDYALIFLHHALWAGESIFVNSPYPNAGKLKEQWVKYISPLLISGNVKAVFSGDGGWRSPGSQSILTGTTHYITGWSGFRTDIPPEWITIKLCHDKPIVIRHKLYRETLYYKVMS